MPTDLPYNTRDVHDTRWGAAVLEEALRPGSKDLSITKQQQDFITKLGGGDFNAGAAKLIEQGKSAWSKSDGFSLAGKDPGSLNAEGEKILIELSKQAANMGIKDPFPAMVKAEVPKAQIDQLEKTAQKSDAQLTKLEQSALKTLGSLYSNDHPELPSTSKMDRATEEKTLIERGRLYAEDMVKTYRKDPGALARNDADNIDTAVGMITAGPGVTAKGLQAKVQTFLNSPGLTIEGGTSNAAALVRAITDPDVNKTPGTGYQQTPQVAALRPN